MTINCNGKLIHLDSPKVMGILNVTPDSFFDGGKYSSDKEILLQTEKMLQQGASFIDIGAYSSKPNATNISIETEVKRITPIVKKLSNEFPEIIISIDTFRSKVAKECLDLGGCMINDISGGNLDKEMFKTVAKYQVPYVLMHMQGIPKNMQNNPTYNNVVMDIFSFFSEKISELKKLQVNDIILDVGFGFGKTIQHNYQILTNLDFFKQFNLPLLTGTSRKSMLYKLLDSTPDKMLNATSVSNTIALLNGSSILRVHDVKEAMECIKIVNAVKN